MLSCLAVVAVNCGAALVMVVVKVLENCGAACRQRVVAMVVENFDCDAKNFDCLSKMEEEQEEDLEQLRLT